MGRGVIEPIRNHSVLVCVQLRGVDGSWAVVLVVLVTVSVSNNKKTWQNSIKVPICSPQSPGP